MRDGVVAVRHPRNAPQTPSSPTAKAEAWSIRPADAVGSTAGLRLGRAEAASRSS